MGDGKRFSTIRTLINRNAMLYPNRTAMIEVEGSRAHTYEALKGRANAMGNSLLGLGLKKGDRVAILSQNSFEYMESALSVPNAGLILVVCNFRLAPPEIAAVLSDAEPAALIVQEQFVEVAQEIVKSVPSVKHLIYFGNSGNKPQGWLDYEEMIKNGSRKEPSVDILEDDIAMLMYTSGTTGFPRASCRPMEISTMQAASAPETTASAGTTVSLSYAPCTISPPTIPFSALSTLCALLISSSAGTWTFSSQQRKRSGSRQACSPPPW